MILCLVCKKNFKNKNALLAHKDTDIHKERLQKSDLKTIFRVNFVSLIYKYNEFKDIVFVYKEFLQKYNLSFKEAGYKSLEEVDFEDSVVVRKEGGVVYVKGYDNFIEDNEDFKIEIEFNK